MGTKKLTYTSNFFFNFITGTKNKFCVESNFLSPYPIAIILGLKMNVALRILALSALHYGNVTISKTGSRLKWFLVTKWMATRTTANVR